MDKCYHCPDCFDANLQADKNARKINEVIEQVNDLIQLYNETEDFIKDKGNELVEEIVNDALGGNIEEINENVTNNSNAIQQMLTEIEQNKNKLTTVENSSSTIQTNVNGLENQLGSLNNNVSSLESYLTNVDGRVTNLENQTEEINQVNIEEMFNVPSVDLTSNSYNVIMSSYNNIANSPLIKVINHGRDSSGNHDVITYIYTPTTGYDKTLYITSGVHGNEIVYPHLLGKFMELLLSDNCPVQLTEIRNHVRIILTPVVNPYGVFTSGGRTNANNVDLNRNCDYRWTEQYETTEGYWKGNSPFSENETQYFKWVVDNYDIDTHIDLHNHPGPNSWDYLAYNSSELMNVSTDLFNKFKNNGDVAEVYESIADSSLSNYCAYIKKIPSCNLEAVRRDGNINSYTRLYYNLMIQHIIRVGTFTKVVQDVNYHGNVRIDSINWESSTGVDISRSDWQEVELFNKYFSYDKNGVMIVNGNVNFTLLNNNIQNPSNGTINIKPTFYNNGVDLFGRMNALFHSGSYACTIPINLVVPVKKGEGYDFRLEALYEGSNDDVLKLKRVKINFVLIPC